MTGLPTTVSAPSCIVAIQKQACSDSPGRFGGLRGGPTGTTTPKALLQRLPFGPLLRRERPDRHVVVPAGQGAVETSATDTGAALARPVTSGAAAVVPVAVHVSPVSIDHPRAGWCRASKRSNRHPPKGHQDRYIACVGGRGRRAAAADARADNRPTLLRPAQGRQPATHCRSKNRQNTGLRWRDDDPMTDLPDDVTPVVQRPARPDGTRETALTPPTRESLPLPQAYAQLGGQRGVAALGVVVFHAYQYDRSGRTSAYPYAGSVADTALRTLDGLVDWFFVLSAFLLALPYAEAALRGTRGSSPGLFLARRAVRIVPLYLVAVMVVWAFRNSSLPGDWRDLLEHLTFTQVFDRKRIFFTIGPAWSLAVEVQFYLLLAVLAPCVVRLAGRRRSLRARLAILLTLPATLLVAGGGYAAATVWLVRPASTDWPWYFGLPAKLVVFGVGVLAAVLLAAIRQRRQLAGDSSSLVVPRAALALRLLAVAGYVLLAPHRGVTGTSDLVFHMLAAPLFAAFVLAGAVGSQDSRWHRMWGSGALAWIGLVSYSLYLWHEPVLLALGSHGLLPNPSARAYPVTVLVLLGVSLAVAAISYQVIERPAAELRPTGPTAGARHRAGYTPSEPPAPNSGAA